VYRYQCCEGRPDSRGCQSCPHVWKQYLTELPAGLPSLHRLPIWTGSFGPEGAAKPRKLLAIDCEMSYTLGGMEVTRFTALDVHGKVLVDSLVQPHEKVIDFNSDFSGIHDLTGARDMTSIWRELIEKHGAYSDTIIVGHGLENDLSMLGLVHARVIDTAVLYKGPEYTPALRHLAPEMLGKAFRKITGCRDTKERAECALQIVLRSRRGI
jgi:RNA exonuclease 1